MALIILMQNNGNGQWHQYQNNNNICQRQSMAIINVKIISKISGVNGNNNVTNINGVTSISIINGVQYRNK
jgi:hypothetical protein